MRKHLAGKQYWTDDEVISAVKDFFSDQHESLIPRESKSCAQPEEVCGPQIEETIVKNKPHFGQIRRNSLLNF